MNRDFLCTIGFFFHVHWNLELQDFICRFGICLRNIKKFRNCYLIGFSLDHLWFGGSFFLGLIRLHLSHWHIVKNYRVANLFFFLEKNSLWSWQILDFHFYSSQWFLYLFIHSFLWEATTSHDIFIYLFSWCLPTNYTTFLNKINRNYEETNFQSKFRYCPFTAYIFWNIIPLSGVVYIDWEACYIFR